MMDFTDAWREDGESETLWENDDDRLLILAPHGGDIEFNTDHAAAKTHKLLRNAGVFPTTWMYHSWGEDAFQQSHVMSTKISGDKFERLGQITDRRYQYAVSFHVQSEAYIGIGGQIDRSIRESVARELASRLPDDKEIRVDRGCLKYSGDQEQNIVNWMTTDGSSGFQL